MTIQKGKVTKLHIVRLTGAQVTLIVAALMGSPFSGAKGLARKVLKQVLGKG